MEVLPVRDCPVPEQLGLGGVRVDPDYHLGPIPVPVRPRRILVPDPGGSPVDRIEVHSGLRRRKLVRVLHVLLNGFVVDLLDKVGAPVPLVPRRIQSVEGALQSRVGYWPQPVHSHLPHLAGGREQSVCLLLRPEVAPDHRCNLLRPELLRERRDRRHSQEREEPIQFLGGIGDELPVPLEHFLGLRDGPERGTGNHGAGRMKPESERSNDAEVAPSTPHRPKEVLVRVGARGDEAPVG